MRVIVNKPLAAIPEMDISDKSKLKEYLSKDPKELYNKEQLEAIHSAIRYTQMYKQEESRAKMDEESPLTFGMPKLTQKELRELGRG